MANVASSLTLYSGVALDNTYEHTYASTSNFSYSSSASPASPLYYIRPDKNMVRIKHSGMKVAGMNLYNCNYLTFNNSSYENKTFYCFVKEVRYINDEVAEIDFEVDVMMTWVATGNVTFEDCFVEREHTDTDGIGEHILEEPVDTGSYIYTLSSFASLTMKLCIGIAGYYDEDEDKWLEGYSTYTEGGLFITDGIIRYYFNSDGTAFGSNPFSNAGALMRSLVTKGGQLSWIKAVYYFPYRGSGATTFISRQNGIGDNMSYVPKNNKLFCYPYNCATVFNNEGASCDYAYELSTSNSGVINFNIVCSEIDANAALIPTNYKQGVYNMMMIKQKFPVGSSSGLAYATYDAERLATMPADLISNVVIPSATGALIGGGAPGAIVGAVGGTISYIAKSLAGGEQAKLQGGSPTNMNSGFLGAVSNTLDFHIYNKTIRTEYARAIDDFFTKFGYKVNRLKTPSKYCDRLSYKYVKTIGCAITGNAPAVVIGKISEIMDNGITFWNKGAIGEY